MKPTQEQLNDPKWWSNNVSDEYDYAFTTGPDWDGNDKCIGTVEFTKEDGSLSSNTGLELDNDCWVLLAKRPTKPAFVPELGVECEVKNRHEKEWGYIKIEGINKKTSSEGEYQVMGLDKNNDYCIYYSEDSLEFRPIKSERELFVEKVRELHKPHNWSIRELAEELYDSGLFCLKETAK